MQTKHRTNLDRKLLNNNNYVDIIIEEMNGRLIENAPQPIIRCQEIDQHDGCHDNAKF